MKRLIFQTTLLFSLLLSSAAFAQLQGKPGATKSDKSRARKTKNKHQNSARNRALNNQFFNAHRSAEEPVLFLELGQGQSAQTSILNMEKRDGKQNLHFQDGQAIQPIQGCQSSERFGA